MFHKALNPLYSIHRFISIALSVSCLYFPMLCHSRTPRDISSQRAMGACWLLICPTACFPSTFPHIILRREHWPSPAACSTWAPKTRRHGIIIRQRRPSVVLLDRLYWEWSPLHLRCRGSSSTPLTGVRSEMRLLLHIPPHRDLPYDFFVIKCNVAYFSFTPFIWRTLRTFIFMCLRLMFL